MQLSGRRWQLKNPHVCCSAVGGHSSDQGWSDLQRALQSQNLLHLSELPSTLKEQEDIQAFPENTWDRWGRSVSSPGNTVEERAWRNWRRSIRRKVNWHCCQSSVRKATCSASPKGWESGPGSEESAPGKQGVVAGWSRSLRDTRREPRHNAGPEYTEAACAEVISMPRSISAKELTTDIDRKGQNSD